MQPLRTTMPNRAISHYIMLRYGLVIFTILQQISSHVGMMDPDPIFRTNEALKAYMGKTVRPVMMTVFRTSDMSWHRIMVLSSDVKSPSIASNTSLYSYPDDPQYRPILHLT